MITLVGTILSVVIPFGGLRVVAATETGKAILYVRNILQELYIYYLVIIMALST